MNAPCEGGCGATVPLRPISDWTTRSAEAFWATVDTPMPTAPPIRMAALCDACADRMSRALTHSDDARVLG